MTYFATLIEPNYNRGGNEVIHEGELLLSVVYDILETGWEDGADRLVTSMVYITEGSAKGRIIATMTWDQVEGQEWPDIVVCYARDQVTRRYARIDTDESYTYKLIG